jgi:hypothetical protein
MGLVTDKFIFLHIPKTAGTSIQDILRKHNNDLRPRLSGAHRTLPQDFRDTEKYKFFVVRNPWDYLVSHWEFTKQKPPKDYFKEKALSLSFSDYVEWLCVTPVTQAHKSEEWRHVPDIGFQSQFYLNYLYGPKGDQKDPSVHVFCLEDGIENILRQVGKDTKARIIYKETRVRTSKRKPYREYYKDNDDLIELVRKYEKPIIDEFDYKF